MRKEFVETKFMSIAILKCPWASKIVQVQDGFMCFECVDDYRTWMNQK